MTRLPTLVAALSLVIGLAACDTNTAAEADENATTAAELPAQAPAITLTPKDPGTDFPDAAITKWAYANGAFDYDYDAATYELGAQSPDAGSTMCANSAKGQHIHLIVDNAPYVAKYEPEFQHEIADGEHRILTFLSRSYHESIKTDAAHRASLVTVRDGGFASEAPITEPMLFYSRPKGTYTGKDTENVLLDFYPVNVELGDDYKVRVETGGQTFTVDEWRPYLLRGLPMGENTVTLTLVDGAGQPVAAPLNPVSRTFTLAADPLGQ